MIIADSKDDKCIKRLLYILEKQNPGMVFDMTIGHTSRIEIHAHEIEKWEENNPGIIGRLSEFCDGYTCGWEDHDE
jgi:hypothetical protein